MCRGQGIRLIRHRGLFAFLNTSHGIMRRLKPHCTTNRDCKTKERRKELGHIEYISRTNHRILSLGTGKSNSVLTEIIDRKVTAEENIT